MVVYNIQLLPAIAACVFGQRHVVGEYIVVDNDAHETCAITCLPLAVAEFGSGDVNNVFFYLAETVGVFEV